ncbi:hypothetical protein F8388_014738 [Cannabis sativa]|uniref:Protein kinase domain-containing protein n=1 Tax=Cannabis sativa TaxID=3483 RepID=A0A7J6GYY8_CANSA|nr:hypothetical protein F8388_014738 [Cannabis sativa]
MEARNNLTLFILMIITTIFHKTTHSTTSPCFSSCGNIHNITFPFRLDTDSPSCVSTGLYHSNKAFVLSCKNNHTTILKNNGRSYYHVEAINYNNYTIRLVDPNIQKGNCSSIPTSYSSSNTLPSPFELQITFRKGERFWSTNFVTYPTSERVLFLSCENKVYNNSLYIDTAPCINTSDLSGNPKTRFLYVAYASGFKYSDLVESCQIYQTALVSSKKDRNYTMMTMSYQDVHDEFSYGFEASWLRILQKNVEENFCYISESYNKDFICLRWRNVVLILAPRTIIGLLFLIGLIIYKWKRRHLSIYKGIEEYLQRQNNLLPIRYSYLDILNMTKFFKIKLGEGGFSSVYKGKLRSGHYVAVKMLSKSKTSGEDFINEVATIGRIHHVNVVRLVGFCVEGGVSHKADVYSFGMLLMEMASRRRNLNTQIDHSSQIYFPLWVYDHVDNVGSIELEHTMNGDKEDKKTKKMLIVALWCIQMKPCDRPSISKVIEMLESHVESLEMPPKPFLYPQDSYNIVADTTKKTLNTTCSSSLSYNTN